MNIESTGDIKLEDLDVDLGMNIDFDDEMVTGVQDTTRSLTDVAAGAGASAGTGALNDDFDMTFSAAAVTADAYAAPAPAPAPGLAAMDFMDNVTDVDLSDNLNDSKLTLQNQQADFVESSTTTTKAIGDVDLDQILCEIEVGADADVSMNVDDVNHANADGFSSSDFTALPTEAGTNDFFGTLLNGNGLDVVQKNPANATDNISLYSVGDEKFLSSLNNIDFDQSNTLLSDSLAQPGHGDIGNKNFLNFNKPTPQVDIHQPASAALSSKSNCSSNSNSTEQKSPEARCHNFTAEKPKYDLRHPWVRVNDTTKGKNNRSGKINQYNPTALYKIEAEPLKNWRSDIYRFKYNQVGELAEPTYSADQIKAYLYNFPASAKRKLRLWIQRAPADSARRYASPESSKCRFRDCPSRRMMNGTIMHGHFRVAFDERWNRYGDDVDPFAAVSGYAHLYCMERFLDFADVCAKLDVELDTRSLSKEPRHRWAAGLNGTPECEAALCFIKKCRSGQLEPEFPNYPLHEEGSLAGKTHERTLTFAMHNSRYKTLRPKQLRGMQSEAPKTSTLYIHFGDVERFCIGRLAERKSQNPNQISRSRATSHTPENRLTPQPVANTPSGTDVQIITGTSTAQPHNHLPRTTTVISDTSSLQNTRFQSIDAIMKDASAQTDESLPPQHPTASSPFPRLFPTHSADNAARITTPTTLPITSDLKRKRSFHRPEPIRTDLNEVKRSCTNKRSRSNDGTRVIYQDETASRRQAHSASPPSAHALDMDNIDEPLSAMMRGLLNELDQDGDLDNDGGSDNDNDACIPNSGASFQSLFGSGQK